MDASTVTVAGLGPLELHVAGRAVVLNGARVQRVLAALLVNRGVVVPVARLAEIVWDGRPPATAVRQVRNLVSGLRCGLDADVPFVETLGTGYRLLASVGSDIADFDAHLAAARTATRPEDAHKRLTEALSLWRGPVFGGIGGPLLDGAAAALTERWLTALEDRVELDLRAGNHREAVAELAALVEDRPLRERFVELLMRALDASNRTSEASGVFVGYRRRLATDLGLDPSPDLRALHDRILRGDDERDAASAADTDRGEPVAPADLTPLFDRSYRALTSSAARLYRLMATVPVKGFTLPALAHLAGLPVTAASDAIKELASAHLVTETAPGRHRLHELLGAHAARLAGETPEPASALRLYRWYTRQTEAASHRLVPCPIPGATATPTPFQTRDSALRWCETEFADLAAVVVDAYESGDDETAWRLPVALWAFCSLGPHRRDWHRLAHYAVLATRRLGDREAEGRVLMSLGGAYAEDGRHDLAMRELTRARALFRAVGARDGEAYALGNLADLAMRTGQHELSIGLLTRARAMLAGGDAPDTWAMSVCEAGLGEAHLAHGDITAAVRHLAAAVEAHDVLDDPWHGCYTRTLLGQALRQAGETAEARTHLERALEDARALRHPWVEARAMEELAETVETGRAAGLRAAALSAYTALDDPRAVILRERISLA
ncbi:hypothetical protein Afil01_29010 [Actinorhabdospora filicis]|uniref:OmpR/PhoB-type domain-containing protein n=1 Tax=Actinorhabdospora filicis TaxID=1785913 RepID=A0A9W6W908_9ACTN|nr:BTAD domain-containing putative transcriptional regulator [Actinorhabdospora filicis]GLZ78094.1 hypothetical protein Afil01_29010 [Actinorhabdospora filicis]